jgi:hypothetical protein
MGGKSMTKDIHTSKLPGSWLLQFAEQYFEQSGLEKIALPIIADIQQEYSSKPQASLARFFILMRSYLSFWKAIGLYSVFSDEGNIRIFKSISFYRLLGTVVGSITAILSWKGNQTPHFVSLIPSWEIGLALLCFLCLAIWFCARQLQAHYFIDIWWVSSKISLPITIILLILNILLIFKLFGSAVFLPAAMMSIFILVLMRAYRLISCFLVWSVLAVSKSMKAA